MQLKYLHIVLLLLFTYVQAASQTKAKPEPPTFNYVTVDINDGKAVLHWTASPTPGITGYIIFVPISETAPGWKPLDTADANTTSIKIDVSQASQHPEKYRIAAYNDEGWSTLDPLDGSHNTMYAFPYFSKCYDETRVDWTPYAGWDKVDHYSVYTMLNFGTYHKLADVGSDTTEFLHTHLLQNVTYCYYIEAHHQSGMISTSNQTCIVTKVPVKPDFLIADYATVNSDGKISVSFSIDTRAEVKADMTEYRLMRASSTNSTYYQFAVYPASSASSEINWTDNSVDLRYVYTYKMVGIDICNREIISSNTATNIKLNVKSDDKTISQDISWNRYESFNGKVKNYNLYRYVDNYPKELVAQLSDLSEINISDNATLFTYKHLLNSENVTGRFCYQVEAIEDRTLNILGKEGVSLSNKVCDDHDPRIFIPNCIVPNSQIEQNRTFRPFVTFAAKDYKLAIYNRWGELIFESADPFVGWDGKMKNGDFAAFGTYVYYLTFRAADSKEYRRCGEFFIYP